jgi:hypothetical protein
MRPLVRPAGTGPETDHEPETDHITVAIDTGKEGMPPKPNYKFERFERQRQKAAKKAARAEAKKEKAEQDKAKRAEPDSADRVPE